MNNTAYGDIIAELEAIVAAEPVVLSSRDLALLEDLDAIQVPDTEETVGPNFVAGANTRIADDTEGGKGEPCLVVSPGQCADHFSSNPPTDTTSYIINAKTLLPGKSQASSLVSGPSTSPSTRSNSVIERISGWKPTSSANTPNAPVRKPRRKAAQLDEVARKKTWDGTKSKNRKDRINDKEKLAAAVWHAAAAGGVAVSLNLGIRREGMLLNHDDPRRRMMQRRSSRCRPTSSTTPGSRLMSGC